MVDNKGVRVLTIDDSKTMQGMLRKVLEGAGYDVIQGGDGVEGLEVLQAANPPPKAVITDINMPRMDGFEVIEAVRKLDQHKHLPVIVLTTESDPEKKARAREAGATGWIVKPFSTESLLAAIRRVTA
ncbi:MULTISPECIES: response regulator [Acetobacter]|jgi:two-component system chemotaxis response regulator CheY|uniref:Two-component system response regulator n=1 Tax=Acetobacter peroxydans TaxID=104098 RepID=A0A4Y3TVT7_9PROT|nr:response regulator [Acetobacter peroxydans]MCH4142997.1 response regulator [Acetobacter peroxydans]MCI1411532.1 response regulator [Acetobacter peroxydans]MCI1440223.1 response regulator [Acetobacter peroxydans]MCI1566709.1 response regulator [Acetobacter peroxydans]MCI1618981.1 response regulator [Acetobacter peroxydans]